MTKRRKIQRPPATRNYKKLFIIAVEGVKTEPDYFGILNNLQSVTHIKHLTHQTKSSPNQVLKRMKDYLKQEVLKKSDEAWLVIDRDQWEDKQLDELHRWSLTEKNYGFALSNPKFEYWLLLHFEDGYKINSSYDCSNRLRNQLPGYGKSIKPSNISRSMINKAIERAKNRDTPPCDDWPHEIGKTTVYKLVENILKE